jgi:hypothetical protein
VIVQEKDNSEEIKEKMDSSGGSFSQSSQENKETLKDLAE